MKTVFLRALEADDKAAALLTAIGDSEAVRGKQRFDVDTASFAAVPRSPFAYWVSDRLRRLFKELPLLEAEGRTAKIGLSTSGDFRFVRLWWAVPIAQAPERRWLPFAKGGKFSPFHADVYLVVNWATAGNEMKAWVVSNPTDPRTSHWSRRIANWEYFFRPGLTWPLRTQIGLAFRVMPAGCIFGHKGPAVFLENDASDDLLSLLSVVNARAFRALVDLQMAFGSYEVGVIQRTPVPKLKAAERSSLAKLARRAWSIRRNLDTRTETSHAFTLPALLQASGPTLAARVTAWGTYVVTGESELAQIQSEIDERCFGLYHVDEADRLAILRGFGDQAESSVEASDTGDADEEAADESDAESGTDAHALAAELVSWAAGVAFGRFDVRLATGVRPLPAEPKPFDALPACSPGMLAGHDGQPLMAPPVGYPLSLPENGILVDDPGHPRDITAALRAVFDELFGAAADAWWDDVAAVLNAGDHDLRPWISANLFEYHLKRYSRSRRKAPIAWQLSTRSGLYSVWLYVHRLTPDSFFQLQNDVVAPKLALEDRRLTSLLWETGGSPSARERKGIAAQSELVEELRALLDELKRVTPLWNPILDDGVVLAMAPLWRLVPRHKPWQRELKGKWSDLVAAKYDWAHLAMHLWPERVVPKCATDRSLAIAHGLEDVFWTEVDGKWKPRPTPTRPVEDLVRERASAAVKDALKNLLDAPLTTTGTARGRVRRIGSAATD